MFPIAFSGLSIVTCNCLVCAPIPLRIPLVLPVPPGMGHPSWTHTSPANRVLCVGDDVGLPCKATIASGSGCDKADGKPVAHINSTFSNGIAKFVSISQNTAMTS